LRPLPKVSYQFALWKRAKVGCDYHIEIKGHYYSVPYTYIGKKVDVRVTEKSVEVFHRGNRIASHIRSNRKGAHTTKEKHMPERHRLYREKLKYLEEQAALIGEKTLSFAKALMDKREHPIQGYRSVLGIINLAKAYPKERVEAACARALEIGAFSYRSVKSILEKGLDQVPLQKPSTTTSIIHPNIRGARYYQKELKGC
jgi:transposase